MRPTRVIFFTWLAWALIIIGFQAWVTARLDLKLPDRARDWTTYFTGPGYQQGHVYLLEPFMNNQVAWDSEYYLAIAVGGYDDPRSPKLSIQTSVQSDPGFDRSLSLSYAFFPFYPLLIRILAFPLQILGLNPIAAAALAGVIVSALGALLGMLALYDLTRGLLGEEGALRAVFYLIIFPTSFFLVQVYSEGLFIGLAFACLAMLKRKHWLAAALLGIAATLTRAVGVALVIPMLIAWFRTEEWRSLETRRVIQEGPQRMIIYHGLLAVTPLIAFLVWKVSYLGQAFDFVQVNNYGRGFLSFGKSFLSWRDAFQTMSIGVEPQSSAYYFTEFLGLVIAISTCIICLRLDPELGWFSLAVVVISWGSGDIQSFHRYILGAPAVFLVLSRWGRNPVFDRTWTILSLLLMGTLAMLFAFNMWVA